MQTRAILLGTLTLALACSACQKKEEALNLLVWEGYADPSFVKAFEERHHCKVRASYMGSSDELVAKLRGGSAVNYDVISPSSDVAASIARTRLAAPLDCPSCRPTPKPEALPDRRWPAHLYSLHGRDRRHFLPHRPRYTLPLEIWGRLRRGITPEINAISSLIFAVSVGLIIIWYRVRTRGLGADSQELLERP